MTPMYSKGSVVRHQSGAIEGVVVNVLLYSDQPVGYYVNWQDGNHSYHQENVLSWANFTLAALLAGKQTLK
ncbi:MAG: hypothetical protein XXXJIFNMEKO3_01095 [Candidatus Erwinia impunctatus]|nr:hypothetical protein XXXJIFNMEKO_01095 [Culicoides impunctatus]